MKLGISAHEVKVNVLFVHLDICVLKIHQFRLYVLEERTAKLVPAVVRNVMQAIFARNDRRIKQNVQVVNIVELVQTNVPIALLVAIANLRLLARHYVMLVTSAP